MKAVASGYITARPFIQISGMVRMFESSGVRVVCADGISKIGYAVLSKNGNGFVDMWTVGARIGEFYRSNADLKADDVSFNYLEKDDGDLFLAVIPRWTGDYEDSNDTYTISEADEQEATADPEMIDNVSIALEAYLRTN